MDLFSEHKGSPAEQNSLLAGPRTTAGVSEKAPTWQRGSKLSLCFGLCHIMSMLWKSRRGGGNNLPNSDQNKTVLIVLGWLGLSCLGAHMPFKSHWFIVWKAEAVSVGLHNSFEALVYSMALLDSLFVCAPSIYRQLHFLLPAFKYAAAATPSAQNILAIVCLCIFIELIWTSWLPFLATLDLSFLPQLLRTASSETTATVLRRGALQSWSKSYTILQMLTNRVLFWKPFQVLGWNSLV